MSLEHRLAEVSESKTENQRIYDAFQQAKSLRREADRIEKELRPEIDALMAQGELVGYPDAYLALQERTTLSADMDALVADVGEKVALRVASVDSKKLRALIDAGLIPKDAPYLTETVATSLVTTTKTR